MHYQSPKLHSHQMLDAVRSFPSLFAAAALLSAAVCQSEDVTAACLRHVDSSCGDENIQSNSLFQMRAPLRRSSDAFPLLRERSTDTIIGDDEQFAPAFSNQERIDLVPHSQGRAKLPFSEHFAGLGAVDVLGLEAIGSHVEESESLSTALRTEVATAMQSAIDDAKKAKAGISADARNAAEAAKAIQDASQDNQEAQAAQKSEARKSAEAGDVLTGALQNVQRAGEVESQELAIGEVVARRLQDAVMGAKRVQALEDEGTVRAARASELLQEALHKLDSPGEANSPNGLKDTLAVVEEAQRAVAADASSKVHASQLLQTSLEGAASAVEALKHSKEVQTSKWLRDAMSNLEWMQATWGQEKAAEEKVSKHLEGAAKSLDSAERLATETVENKQSVEKLVEDVARKTQDAQDMANKEAAMASAAQNAAEVREARTSSSLQKALSKLQMQEEAAQASRTESQDQAMQTTRQAQLASQLSGLMQSVKASNDAQQMQLARVVQQLSQAMGGQSASPPQMGQIPGGQPVVPQEMMQVAPQMQPQGTYMQGPLLQPTVALR